MNLAIYLAGTLIFMSGFYFVKKSDAVWNGVCTVFLSYIVWLAMQSLFCSVTLFFHIKMVAWQSGMVGAVIGGIWWGHIFLKKQRQKYQYEFLDVMVSILILAFTIGWSWYQFGKGLENFNYRSVTDSARHLDFARTLVEQGKTRTFMTFAAGNTAVWMSAMQGIISRFYQFKIYIVFDLTVFFLNGMIFWAAIRRFLSNRYLKMVGVVFTFLFVWGHPLNSLAYGTIYLSTGIMLTVSIYHVAMLSMEGKLAGDGSKGILALFMLGLYESYLMFIPVFVGGVLIYLFYFQKKQKGEITQKLIRRSWILWGTLFVLGIVYLYLFYVTGDAVLFNDLRLEGLMYGHPYADFLFLIPFLLMALWDAWKNQKIELSELLFLLELALVITMGIGTPSDRVSVYYFYKSYVALWGVAFITVIQYLSHASAERKPAHNALFITWALLLILFFTDAENHLYQISARYGKLSTAQACFPMYEANLSMPRELDDVKELNELIMCAAKYSCENNIRIPYISDEEGFDNRYYSLAAQDPEWKFNYLKRDNPIQDLKKNYKYVVVTWDEGITRDRVRGLEPKEILFENSAGYFARISG